MQGVIPVQVEQSTQDRACPLQFLRQLRIWKKFQQIIQLGVKGSFLILRGLIAGNSKIPEQPAAKWIKGLAQDLVRLAQRPERSFSLLPGGGAKFMDEPSLAYPRFSG